MTLRAPEIRGALLFFPLALGFAALWVPLWMARYAGALPPPTHFAGAAWHGHEMIFGYMAAVVAGVLTVSDHGWRVLGLVGVWVLARVLLLVETPVPPAAISVIDLTFLPMLLVLRRPRLWSGAKLMTLGIAAVIAALTAVNAWSHWTASSGDSSQATHTAALLIAVLMVVVAGRLVPGHTRAATRRGPGLALARTERASIATAVALVAAHAAGLHLLVGVVAAALAGLQAYRLYRWRDRAVLRDPLLWGLHLGFGWLVLGLGAYGLAEVGAPVPATDALHLVLIGGAGTLTLSIMMRLTRAHGRLPQTGGWCETAALALISVAAATRGIGPMVLPSWRFEASLLGAAAWTAAFLLAFACYEPVLRRLAPRRGGGDARGA